MSILLLLLLLVFVGPKIAVEEDAGILNELIVLTAFFLTVAHNIMLPLPLRRRFAAPIIVVGLSNNNIVLLLAIEEAIKYVYCRSNKMRIESLLGWIYNSTIPY